jgi:hypothetical protein
MAIPGMTTLGGSAAAGIGASFVGTGPVGSVKPKLDAIYSVEPTNWYKSLPYGFVSWDKTVTGSEALGPIGGRLTMYLPISPENIKVTTHFATNVVTTLYGVIEEHSEPRYYDIVISGTTGFAPRYIAPQGQASAANVKNGRESFEPSFQVNLGGFFQEQVGVINSIIDNVNSIADTLTGKENPTGIKPENSGYMAFHNLYRYLMHYKRDTAGAIKTTASFKRTQHPLQFLNYKDQVKYDVVPITFDLMRNATNPMLYNYSIVMRGFNMRDVTANPPEIDVLSTLGLGTVDQPINGTSFFASAQSLTGDAANIISAGLSF